MEAQSITVIFYTKAGCHLCDDAREALNELARAWTFTVEEIDIRRDSALFEQYKYRIPVLLISKSETKTKNEIMLEAPITREQIQSAFQQIDASQAKKK